MKFKALNSLTHKIFHVSKELLLSPLPLRVELIRFLSRKFNLFGFLGQLDIESLEDPYLAYCMLNSAIQAKGLGIKNISAIKFGVCSGSSLALIENYSKEIEKLTGVSFNTYGFMFETPKGDNYKDQDYFWEKGDFKTDLKQVRKNIKTSTLVLGDIKNTVQTFFEKFNPPPIGFISFDLYYYTPTISAFEIFNFSESNFLPRVECFIDDISSFNELSACKGTGVLNAIEEFNKRNNDFKKIFRKELVSQFRRYPNSWNEKIYVYHDFSHRLYNIFLGKKHI